MDPPFYTKKERRYFGKSCITTSRRSFLNDDIVYVHIEHGELSRIIVVSYYSKNSLFAPKIICNVTKFDEIYKSNWQTKFAMALAASFNLASV